jgi:hypothetical protein
MTIFHQHIDGYCFSSLEILVHHDLHLGAFRDSGNFQRRIKVKGYDPYRKRELKGYFLRGNRLAPQKDRCFCIDSQNVLNG